MPRLLGRADCGRGYSHLKFAHVTIPGPPAHKTFAHQCRPCSPGPEKHVEKHADPLICTFQNDVVKKRIQLCPRMYKALTDCGKLQCVETVPMCGSVVAREKMFCSKCKTAISCQWCSRLGTSRTLESKQKNRHVLICSYVGMGTKCLLRSLECKRRFADSANQIVIFPHSLNKMVCQLDQVSNRNDFYQIRYGRSGPGERSHCQHAMNSNHRSCRSQSESGSLCKRMVCTNSLNIDC